MKKWALAILIPVLMILAVAAGQNGGAFLCNASSTYSGGQTGFLTPVCTAYASIVTTNDLLWLIFQGRVFTGKTMSALSFTSGEKTGMFIDNVNDSNVLMYSSSNIRVLLSVAPCDFQLYYAPTCSANGTDTSSNMANILAGSAVTTPVKYYTKPTCSNNGTAIGPPVTVSGTVWTNLGITVALPATVTGVATSNKALISVNCTSTSNVSFGVLSDDL